MQCSLGCFGNCRHSDGYCYQCKVGSWSNTCEINCSDGCLDACSQFLGHCSKCVNGYWGVSCSERCEQGCKSETCDKINGYCDICYDGYWGNMCEYECNVGCNACNKSNGFCTCKSGYFGDTCSFRCSSQCKALYLLITASVARTVTGVHRVHHVLITVSTRVIRLLAIANVRPATLMLTRMKVSA